MANSMKTVTSVEVLRNTVARWRAQGLRTALVPTMGALHEGHLSLVREAKKRADRVVASVFVNPKQFAPGEDLDKYPRDIAGDKVKLRDTGTHVLFMPDVKLMYPEGFSTTVSLEGPATAGLEDTFRPSFFDGVTTVVAKLFNQAGCDYAMFGEKDYQQLKVITRMARDLDMPVTIIPVETVRDSDGLALSSRNVYLSTQERKIAPNLYNSLKRAAEQIGAGAHIQTIMDETLNHLKKCGFRVEYVAARHANTLAPIRANSEPVRILAAAWLGKTRLIDNIGATQPD